MLGKLCPLSHLKGLLLPLAFTAPRQKAMSESESEMFFIHICEGTRHTGLRKRVPRVQQAKNRADKSQQGPGDTVSAPSNKKGVRSQTKNSYFGNITIMVFVFLRLTPFLFFVTIW